MEVIKDLKPCPFCGRKVELIFRNGDYGYTPNSVSIRCKHCEIGFSAVAEEWKKGVGVYSIRQQAEEKVIKKWNGRVNSAT